MKKINVKSSTKQELNILWNTHISFYFFSSSFSNMSSGITNDIISTLKFCSQYIMTVFWLPGDEWTCTTYTGIQGGREGEREGGMWWETRYREWFHILGLMNSNKMRTPFAACEVYWKTEPGSR